MSSYSRKKDSILLYLSDYEAIKDMPNEDFGSLMRAIFEYHLRGTEPEDPKLVYAFKLLNGKIIRANHIYQQICEEKSRAGKKGNQIRWHSQSVAKIADGDSDGGCDNDIIEIKKIFLFDKGCFSVNREYERFCAHYDKSGWLDGNGVPITNKVACAKCWTPRYKDDTEKNNSLGYSRCWKSLYEMLADKEGCELMITDIYGISFRYNKVHICIGRPLCDFLRANYDDRVEAVLKTMCDAIEWNIYEPR